MKENASGRNKAPAICKKEETQGTTTTAPDSTERKHQEYSVKAALYCTRSL
jgi:hypothetical protein